MSALLGGHMKAINEKQKQWMVGACLALGGTLGATTSRADVTCTGEGGLPLLKGFELSDYVDYYKNSAAVILKTGTVKALLTGTVEISPTRVGSIVHYEIVDASGAKSKLSYSTKDVILDFDKCTRAGCETFYITEFHDAQLVHNGETYELKCQNLDL